MLNLLRRFIPLAVGAAGLVILLQRPVVTDTLRIAEILCLMVFVGGLLALAWRPAAARWSVIGVCLLLAAFLACPFGPRVSEDDERAAIAEAAVAYAGAPYVWGGEARNGIDCSGLVRRAYIDAAVSLGLHNFSPAHLRRAIRLWAHDTSARDFEGKPPVDGRVIVRLPSLRGATPATVLPGDCAIVGNGLHVLLYLGDNRWIQADPEAHEVIEIDAKTDKNMWLRGAATILRPGFLDRDAPERP